MKNIGKTFFLIIALAACLATSFVRADYPVISQDYTANPTATVSNMFIYILLI